MAPNTSGSVNERDESLSVCKLVENAPLGLVFKIKEDVVYGARGRKFSLKKGTKLILDEKDNSKVGLKVFPKGIKISDEGVLESDFTENTLTRKAFEELVGNSDMTNFSKKVLETLEG